ncbi:transposase [Streptomyces capillispiralis]|uniref:transposase n=1 Tax=Streptomyces capillispiralis TaxID=68182 RepID=UPI0016779EBF
MIRRHELSDAEWEFVRPLLPVSLRGRKRLDDRRVLNGIVWKFRTGTAWRDVPDRYSPWATLHTRFRMWAVSVDSTAVWAHQHAAGARKGGLRPRAIGRLARHRVRRHPRRRPSRPRPRPTRCRSGDGRRGRDEPRRATHARPDEPARASTGA